MTLSEHVYCVAVTFKMTEQVEQWICIKFCVKLEHFSPETIQMIQRPQLWATGDWQFHHNNAPAHTSHLLQSCLVKHQIARWLSPPTAQIWCPVTSGFSQNQNHLWKGRDFRPSMGFRKIQQSSWWWLGELCEIPRWLLWRGLRCHCPMYNVSYILFSSKNVSIFHITWLDTFSRPHIF